MGLLVATTKPGAEKQSALELGDALFRRDPKVDPQVTRYPGTILVETSIPSLEAYIIILGTFLATPLRVIPLVSPSTLRSIVNRILPDREALSSIFIRCELRGRREECGRIEEKMLAELGFQPVPRSRARLVLHIEGVDDKWGVMIMPRDCDSLNAVYADASLKRSCVQYAKKLLTSIP